MIQLWLQETVLRELNGGMSKMMQRKKEGGGTVSASIRLWTTQELRNYTLQVIQAMLGMSVRGKAASYSFSAFLSSFFQMIIIDIFVYDHQCDLCGL